MAVKYLSGNRIWGTNAERLAMTTSGSSSNTSWKELDRVTVAGSSTGLMDTGVFPNGTKDNLMILCHVIGDGSETIHPKLQFNSDTSTNYNSRVQTNGATDWLDPSSGTTGATALRFGSGTSSTEQFIITQIRNNATDEKLVITQMVYTQSGTLYREQSVGKWINTSDQIESVQVIDSYNDMAVGSEVVVLGCDDDESPTWNSSQANFWQQIEKSPAYVSGTDMDSSANVTVTNTFTPKKYMMVDVLTKAVSTNYANAKWRFNGDNASNYTTIYADNGGADSSPSTGDTIMTRVGEVGSSHALASAFIINTTNDLKLGIINVVQGSSGASTAPTKHEVVFKWTETEQIENMGIVSSSGSGTNLGELEVRIWGNN